MVSFLAGLGPAVLAILLLERLVKPRVDARPFFHRVSLLAAMPAVVFFMTMFMLSYRPIFSFVATLITFAAIIIVNNAKYAALKEPLVFSDFALLRQVIHHPALYVKYIGVLNIIGVVLASAGAIAVGLTFEPPIVDRQSAAAFVPMLTYLFVVFGMIYAVTRGPLRGAFIQFLRRFGQATDVRQDMDKLSLVVCLIFYFFLANEPNPKRTTDESRQRSDQDRAGEQAPGESTPERSAAAPALIWTGMAGGLPPVVMVQNESFFDARRLSPAIGQDVLQHWDTITAEAAYRGRLSVPAWGANTMRTEFAVLSGLPNAALGVHRFNPYLSLCKRPVWTMAHQMRSLGYRTVCVHPYAPNFFNRDIVFPNLGFDLFMGIEAFEGADYFGPYVRDRAVAERILNVLDDDGTPTFIFAITMENHGKWESDRLDGHVPAAALRHPPLGSRELALYLAHLRNADEMAALLVSDLRQRAEGSVFCMYGDHVPSLPDAFTTAGYQDPRTDYVVWKEGGRNPRDIDIAADGLGRIVMDAALNQVNQTASGRSWTKIATAS